MTIYLYTNFEKRLNSTKRPDLDRPTKTLTGYLKEPCSIINPIFRIERLVSDESPQSYVYAVIPVFNRFYFVEDWTWADGVWECNLQLDVLATWRTQIGASSAYIDRCASESDGSIIDMMYPAKTNFNMESSLFDVSYYNKGINDGCFIIGIINDRSTTASQNGGAVTYYVLAPSQLRALMAYLLSSQFLEDAGFSVQFTTTQIISQDMSKVLINPLDWISTCMWFPLPVSSFTTASSGQIYVGYWVVPQNICTGQILEATTLIIHGYGQVPTHPNAAVRGKYLNYAPYTSLTLELPPFGLIPIDTSYLEIGSYLYADIYVDSITGHAQLLLTMQYDYNNPVANSPIITEASGMLGVPIQLAQINADYAGFGVSVFQSSNSFMGAVMSAMSGNIGSMGGQVSNMTNNIMSAVESKMPQVRTSGSNGALTYTKIKPRITAHHLIPIDEDNTELGRPLKAIRTINTLSGYIRCNEISVDYACFASEKKLIHEYMLTGFFWE